MKFEFRIILLLATALPLIGLPQACADDAPASVLDSLETKHPRLMLKEPALQNLKERAKKDVVLQGLVRGVINKADDCLTEPMLTYTKRGPRLLHVSKACLVASTNWGLPGDGQATRNMPRRSSRTFSRCVHSPIGAPAISSIPRKWLMPSSPPNRPLPKSATKASVASSSVYPKLRARSPSRSSCHPNGKMG